MTRTKRLLVGAALGLFVGCGEGTAERRTSAPSAEPGNVPTSDVAGEMPTPDVSGDAPAPSNLAGGETSEFSGGDVPGCPCGTLRNPVRATITDVGVESVRVRVDELLGNDPGVAVGAEIEGSWYGGLPCYTGRAAVAVGDTVLAFYWPADPGFRGRIALTPWGESVMLAKSTRGELIVSLDELSLLDAPVAECVRGLGNISDYLGPDDNLP